MNDLRRLLVWLAALAVLAIGVWSFHQDEITAARPFAPENRAFRLENRVNLFGFEFSLPFREMTVAWVAVALAVAALWPFASDERSRRLFGSWERPRRPRKGREAKGV